MNMIQLQGIILILQNKTKHLLQISQTLYINQDITVKYEITSDRSSLSYDVPLEVYPPHFFDFCSAHFRSVTTIAMNHYNNSSYLRNSRNKQTNDAKEV